MQNYNRVYGYIYDYWKRIYDTYSKHAIAYLVTYYNVDSENTIWDNEDLMGGYYEKIGNLSGLRWVKYHYLPVFFITETATDFESTEEGYINTGATEIVIPSTYNITPYPNDIIKLDQTFLIDDHKDDDHAVYTVSGLKKQSPCDKTFWHLDCNVEQSRTTKEIDKQVLINKVFFEYTKNIHTLDDAITLTKLLIRNEEISDSINQSFDKNSGLLIL